jgi:hypothetical protein
MNTVPLILLSLLGGWWVLLTLLLIWNYRARVRAPKTPLTPAEREEIREWEAGMPRHSVRPIDYLIIIPVILIMLPVYLYGRLVEDPYAKFDRLSVNQRDEK